MTNSIATAKCPSTLSSGNYGMSQNRYSDESKDYFFVKLTDSAYRAIEEYQHNENSKRFTNGQRPKIQVNGNSGVIYFPTLDSNEGRKFGFTIDDIEGSLECIQQTSEGLDVLGSIPYRMRIHANDDIYDTTRTKMAIAEETEKSKCIREIKPNQTDIGRKVKKSVPSSTVYPHLSHSGNNNGNNNNSSSNYLSSLSRSKLTTSLNSNSPPTTQLTLNSGSGANERMNNKLGGTNLSTSSSSSRSPNPTLLGGSGTIASGTNSTNNRYGNGNASNVYSQSNLSPSLPSLTSASSLSSTLAGGIANGYASATQHNSPNESTASTLVNSGVNSKQSRLNSNVSGGNGNFSRGGGGGAFSSNGSKAGGGTKGGAASNANGGGSKLPDISRRKIRERLIHLLALRPFKKPELYARLQNEGLRDRERSLISNILKDIALSRDNTYNLRRQMWNDVNENWPYYTEQELQQLKRRKPQNLTPPLSSDAGSSTSGQSPTSTHTGSPPPLAGGMNGGNSLKRTSLEYDEPFPPKKQRISHMAATGAGVNRMTATSNNSAGGSGVRAGASFSTISNSKNSGNTSFSMQRNKHATTKASTYSPQGPRNTTQSSENSVSSDLSYNVLNNMDDFMLNIENPQGSGYAAHCCGSSSNGNNNNNARKSNGSGNSKSSNSNPKENRHSGNSSGTFSATTNISPKNNNNSGNGNNSNYNVQENECSSNNLKHTLKRSSLASSPKSSLPYGVNFVPESSSSNSRSAGRDNSNRSGSGNYRHQSPNYTQQQQQKQQKSSNSVIYSPKIQATTNIGKNEREDHVPAGRSNGSSKSQTTSHSMGSSTASASGSNKQQMRGVGVRTPTPPVQEQQRYLQQGTHYQSQQTHSASTNSPVQRHNNQPQHLHQQEQQQHQQLQFESNSQLPVTQHSVITDAVDVDAAETPNYDFSSYTAITSIEQRRQYKTEFERDYDEYRQLLERIEDVRRNFQVLADQLQRAPQGCSDYEHIKEQIVAEYERINNEEELKRDKQRFDYLHAKLAHIKQLVTDYDKTLTSMAAAAAAVAAAQHHQQQQQEQQLLQHASTTAAMHMAAGATSHFVDGSTNVLTAATAHNARVSPMVSGSESNHSPPSGYQNQTQYYIQQQLQQQPNQIIQHQQEQHQHQNNDETLHRKKKHTHNILQRHHNQQQQQQQHQQYYLSPENQTHASSFDEQHSAQHHQQREPEPEQFNGYHHYQGNNNNDDSDSDDSSDSNDEDSNDDDSNDDDDDNGSDHDSNNDDDVNEHF